MYKIEYRQRNYQHANTAQKQEKKTEIIIAICTEKKNKTTKICVCTENKKKFNSQFIEPDKGSCTK